VAMLLLELGVRSSSLRWAREFLGVANEGLAVEVVDEEEMNQRHGYEHLNPFVLGDHAPAH